MLENKEKKFDLNVFYFVFVYKIKTISKLNCIENVDIILHLYF